MHGRHNYSYTLLTYNSPSLSLSVLHTSMRGHNAHVSLLSHDTTASAATALLVAALAGFLHLSDHGTALTAGPLSSMVAVREVKKSGKRRNEHRPDEQRLGPDENRTAARPDSAVRPAGALPKIRKKIQKWV